MRKVSARSNSNVGGALAPRPSPHKRGSHIRNHRLNASAISCACSRLWIASEPTAGLDPTERNRFLNLLAGISEEVTVILSTHIVEDVRELCRQMAIIAQGRVIAEGDPEAVFRKREEGCST